MHHLENKPGMLLCCLLTKSLFRVKLVAHFRKTLTCCGFCRFLFLTSMSRTAIDAVNLWGLPTWVLESRGMVQLFRSAFSWGGGEVLHGAWGDVVRSKNIIQVRSMGACGGKGHWCSWLNAFGRLWNAEQHNVQVSVMWLNNTSQLNWLLSWESPKEELGHWGYWEREWQCVTFLSGRLRVAVLTFAD